MKKKTNSSIGNTKIETKYMKWKQRSFVQNENEFSKRISFKYIFLDAHKRNFIDNYGANDPKDILEE